MPGVGNERLSRVLSSEVRAVPVCLDVQWKGRGLGKA
jgi:hypothetical protein